MAISDLIPWRREQEVPVALTSLQREMNRMFDDSSAAPGAGRPPSRSSARSFRA